jgi:hypothetical protein
MNVTTQVAMQRGRQEVGTQDYQRIMDHPTTTSLSQPRKVKWLMDSSEYNMPCEEGTLELDSR